MKLKLYSSLTALIISLVMTPNSFAERSQECDSCDEFEDCKECCTANSDVVDGRCCKEECLPIECVYKSLPANLVKEWKGPITRHQRLSLKNATIYNNQFNYLDVYYNYVVHYVRGIDLTHEWGCGRQGSDLSVTLKRKYTGSLPAQSVGVGLYSIDITEAAGKLFNLVHNTNILDDASITLFPNETFAKNLAYCKKTVALIGVYHKRTNYVDGLAFYVSPLGYRVLATISCSAPKLAETPQMLFEGIPSDCFCPLYNCN